MRLIDLLVEHIGKVKGGYRLYSRKGKNLGTFGSHAAAEKHEHEVEYFKHMDETDTYQPPELSVGDKILKGKFKNSPAEIKGFTKDKHNQPVLKTNRGEVQLFKPRVAKLMDKDVVEGLQNIEIQDDKSIVTISIGGKERFVLQPATGHKLKSYGGRAYKYWTIYDIERKKDRFNPNIGMMSKNQAIAYVNKIIRHEEDAAKVEQGVAEGKIKLYTDPDYFGAEVDDTGFDSLPVVKISADRLVGFEPDDKMKEPTSRANVKKILAGIKQGDKLPPLLVRKYKDGYQILDGHHRFWAYKLSGTKSIPVRIVADKDIEEISKPGVAKGTSPKLSAAPIKIGSIYRMKVNGSQTYGKVASINDDRGTVRLRRLNKDGSPYEGAGPDKDSDGRWIQQYHFHVTTPDNLGKRFQMDNMYGELVPYGTAKIPGTEPIGEDKRPEETSPKLSVSKADVVSVQGVAEDREYIPSGKERITRNGIDLVVGIDGATVDIRAMTGDSQMAYVVFDRDGDTLVADDLAVEEQYKGQGIAKIMYDYVKELGFRVKRSSDQLVAGKKFWDKNKGAENNIWEQGVAEGAGNNLQTIIKSFVDSSIGQKYKQHDCKTVTRAFVQWAEQNKIPTQVVSLAPPSADFIAKNPQFQSKKGKPGEGNGHIMPIVNGEAIDFTVRQFGVERPFENPLVTLINSLPAVYGKFGYFTDNPDWFAGGKSQWIGPLSSIPNEILNQNFSDEMLEQGVAEGAEQNYLSQIPNLTWKPVSRSVWNTIQDEGLDQEQDAPKHTDWVMASLSIDPKDAQALQAFDSDAIEDFNRFDIHLKSRYPGLTDLIDYDRGTVTIVKTIQMQGVAEGTEKVNPLTKLTNAVISFYKPVVDQIEPGAVDDYDKQAKELLNQAPDPTIRSRMREIFQKGQKDPMIQGGVITAIAAILTGGLLSSASRMGLSPAQTNILLQAVLNTVIPTIIARINNKSWSDTIKYTLASVGVGMTAAATLSEKRVTEGLSIDVPNEQWLQDKIDYAKSKGRDEWGAPFFGTTTAYARPNPQVSVVRLELLKGMRNEQNNVRKTDLEWLMARMEKTGKLPLTNQGEEYAPFVMVAYNGEAWVSEGNHRIMAAYRLGWKKMPIEIKYFDGGERVQDGIMYPGKIGLGQPAAKPVREAYTGPQLKWLKPGELRGSYTDQQLRDRGFNRTGTGKWFILLSRWNELIAKKEIQ